MSAQGIETEQDTRQGVAAVDRALAILGAISASPEPCTLARLSAGTGLYKSTILRLLGSLEPSGYVVRLGDGRYTLGAAAAGLGRAYDRLNPLRIHVRSVLERLVAEGSESASFHVPHGPGTRLCLIRIDSGHATLDRVREGDVMPLNGGAPGRVLLAFAGEPGDRYDRIRAECVGHSDGELNPACAAISSPVFAADGALAGAVSLSGPRERFTDEMRAAWSRRLAAAAAEITRALGGRFPGS